MAQERTRDIDLGITRLEYGDENRPQRAVLTLTTRKYYNGGLISDATVYWVGHHSKQNMMSLGGDGGDYGKRLRLSERTVKATQRNIDAEHAAAFPQDVIESMTQAAKDHYARFVRAGIDGYKNVYLAPTSVVSV